MCVAANTWHAAASFLGENVLAKIPQVLHEHINTAYPANVCLIGTVLPNGIAPDYDLMGKPAPRLHSARGC